MGSYKLYLDTPKRNVFVTQLRDDDEDDSAQVNKYPIVHESSSKLVSTGIKTLQSTLLIKQKNEAANIQRQLENQRRTYREKMAACKIKEDKLRKRQQQIKERVNKFDKFIKETEAKRRRALEKYQTENKLKEQKTRELGIYSEELRKLRQRQTKLQKRVDKYSVYEKYLMKVLDIIPEDYIENSSDSKLLGIMMRFTTLSSTNQSLTDSLTTKNDEIKLQQQTIQDIKQEHNQQLMVDSSELASLQYQLENKIQRNARLEQSLQAKTEIYRSQSTALGKVKLAVINIAEKCIKKHSPPLASMDIDDMLILIKDFLREHEDICRMARKSEFAIGRNVDFNETSTSQSIPKKEFASGKLLNPKHKNVTQSPNMNSKRRSLLTLETAVHAVT